MKQILFVCSGNTCRSAMAEGIWNAMAKARGHDARAVSCGLSAFPGDAAAPYAARAAQQYGADLARHRARAVNAYALEEADRIFCMTRAHLQALWALYPACREKTALLGTEDISDPWGGDQKTYEAAAREIAEAIRRQMDEME